MRTNPKSERRETRGGYALRTRALPTPGRIYLHPARTWGARWRLLGDHDIITTARWLQGSEPHQRSRGM